jgi:hypothetical protein
MMAVRLHLFFALATTFILPLNAQVPMVFNYQGRIVDGTNLVNGTLAVVIDLYDAETGGGRVYSETQTLSVLDGLYSLSIGASNNTPGSLLSALESDTVYLELTFDATVLSPRSRIVSVTFAAVSRFAESLDTGDRALFSDPLRLTRSDSRISRGRTQIHIHADKLTLEALMVDAGGVLRLTADVPVAVRVSPGERYRDNAIISRARASTGPDFPSITLSPLW